MMSCSDASNIGQTTNSYRNTVRVIKIILAEKKKFNNSLLIPSICSVLGTSYVVSSRDTVVIMFTVRYTRIH